jgi:hypothetical protein
MMSEEKEEKKVLFVSVCVISNMMVNAKQVCTKSTDDSERCKGAQCSTQEIQQSFFIIKHDGCT